MFCNYILPGSKICLFQQTQNMCITFMQRRPKVFDIGPTLYKCYTNVLLTSKQLTDGWSVAQTSDRLLRHKGCENGEMLNRVGYILFS